MTSQSPISESDSTTPEVVNSRSVLFFDSDCGVCSAFVDWLVGRAGADVLAVAYSDPAGPAKFPSIDFNHADHGVQVLIAGGERVLQDARAIAFCLQRTRHWMWVGVLIDLPVVRVISQWGYQIFARNRRHISRCLGLDACKIRPPSRP